MATISSLLADHVRLQVRSVDRILLAGYVPSLQADGQLVTFLNQRAGGTIPSPAILGKIGQAYVDEINAFAKANDIPVVRFAKGEVKEDVARKHMQKAEREDRTGVVMLGVAQEKAFALKGGTAINLFVRDLPRLSVDIDLTYLPIAPRPQSLANINAAMKRIAGRIKAILPDAQITEATAA